MENNLLHLHDQEVVFIESLAQLENEFQSTNKLNEIHVNQFANQMANYSKYLNQCLKSYADIDYFSEKTQKIHANALIKYGYDFLELLTEILKTIELKAEYFEEVETKFTLLEDFVAKKPQLMDDTYTKVAIEELEAFYNPSIREKLQLDLLKRINASNNQKYHD